MLSKAENEYLCRIGPGTPMGNLMRQYWLPAIRSDELAEPDGAPLRVRLLGEDLIGFRAIDRPGRPDPEQLPASRRVAVLRPQRRGRPAVRLPRLEVRRQRHVRRHAQRAGRVRLQTRRSRRSPIRPASATASSGRTWARAATPPPLPDFEANMLGARRPGRLDHPPAVQLDAGLGRRDGHRAPGLPARGRDAGRGHHARHVRLLHRHARRRRASR